MSSSSAPSDEAERLHASRMDQSYRKFVNGVTLGTLFLAPIMVMLPPRRLNFTSLAWGGAFAAAAVHREIPAKMARPFLDISMPRRARELKEQRERDEQRRRMLDAQPGAEKEKDLGKSYAPKDLLEEKAREIWMGGETEGWKERRLQEEREKLAQGEGYGSMIMEQIWEVWNWGGKKGEDDNPAEGASSSKGT
ncbi:hypothetical protein LTR84_008505 [Exophiala bonariae]|uniref:Rhomboid family membrane protein n=1 Tax=Exophiala bonariae TaxID=1690606 RepID=A0AAV9MZR0_9EURO|nr:hypothetical protein LTR84_008505 [Exophiala bonariae]